MCRVACSTICRRPRGSIRPGQNRLRAIQRAVQAVNLSIRPDPAILAWREQAGSDRRDGFPWRAVVLWQLGGGVVRARALVLQQQPEVGFAARSRASGADGMGRACGSRRKRSRYAASSFRPAHRAWLAGHRHAGDVLVERRPAISLMERCSAYFISRWRSRQCASSPPRTRAGRIDGDQRQYPDASAAVRAETSQTSAYRRAISVGRV